MAGRQIPWERIYKFINSCGNLHEIQPFSAQILHGLSEFVPYDRGIVFFIDANHNIRDQFLLNVKDGWVNMYLDYYSKARMSEFSIENRVFTERPGEPLIDVIRWYEQPSSEFISDYIRVQNLQLSLGFVLFDLNGFPRIAFALDRMRKEDFTEQEIEILKIIHPALNNLHKNFYASSSTGLSRSEKKFWEGAGLTEREIEVTNLLCQGLAADNIGQALHISTSTVYKHIAHIYSKMNVSTLQELLVKILNSSSN